MHGGSTLHDSQQHNSVSWDHLCIATCAAPLVHVVWVPSDTFQSLVLGASQRLLGHVLQQALYTRLSPLSLGRAG